MFIKVVIRKHRKWEFGDVIRIDSQNAIEELIKLLQEKYLNKKGDV